MNLTVPASLLLVYVDLLLLYSLLNKWWWWSIKNKNTYYTRQLTVHGTAYSSLIWYFMLNVFSRAPSSVGKRARLVSISIFFILCARDIFCKTAEPIFNKSSRKMAIGLQIGKFSFWFLDSFGWRKEVQNGHFRFGPSFIKFNVAAKHRFTYRKNESCLILAG